MNLTRELWPLGWIPNANENDQLPLGLLRMDNLCYDEENCLSLARGVSNINPTDFNYSVHSCFSRNLHSTKFRFVGLSDASVRYSTDGNTWNNVLTSGSATRAAFTSALGHVFIFSGNQRKKLKWDGSTVSISNITPTAPTSAPSVQEAAKNDFVFVSTSFTGFGLVEGTSLDNSSNYVQWTTFNSRGSVRYTPASPWNTMVLGANGKGQPTDLFLFYVRISDTSKLKSIRVIFNYGTSYAPIKDYYWYKWDNDSLNSPFNAGTDAWTALKCRREDFSKEGSSGGWESIKSIQIIVTATDGEEVTVRVAENGILFAGYNENPLDSDYQYIQVNVNNTGSYLAKSKPSPISNVVTLRGGRAQITCQAPSDSQVNEVWVYRRDASYLKDTRDLNTPIKLDRWYRVKVLTSGFSTPFEDYVSDEEALLIGETLDTTVESVSTYTPDTIIGVSDFFNGRLVLMGEKDVYFTELDDPGLYNPRWGVRLSGSSSEKNLWITSGGPNSILVGTTSDIYEISGTAEELPDGTLNIQIIPLGITYPPISRAFAKDNNFLAYVASDGIRTLNGRTSLRISGPLDLLFAGQSRHGVDGIETLPADQSPFAMAVSKSKLFVTAKCASSSTKYTYVYDLKKEKWFLWTEGPNVLFTEEDDTLIGGYGGSVPAHLKILWSGSSARSVEVRTIFDYNNQPRNRKDVFTLKVTADSGGSNVAIYMTKDNGTEVSLGNYAFSGKQEKQIQIATTVGLGVAFQLRLVVSSTTQFKLYNFTIEYDPRPEQLNYLRIPPTNLGTISRKRIETFGIVIDTLGNTITMTPLVDNVAQAASTFSINYKGTYVHRFSPSVVGVDIGAILSGGLFEFYEVNLNESVSEKLPPAVTYHVIPPTDFGSPARKRVRTIPMKIFTNGSDVTFTPIVDGVAGTPTVFNTTEPKTVFHYFTNDSFGIDYSGTLSGSVPFEFYGFMQPEIVDILPVSKLRDQVGPVEFNRLGRLVGFRIKVFCTGTSMNYAIYFEDGTPYTGSFTTVPNALKVYEVMRLPSSYKGTMCRIEFSSDSIFHRYTVELRVMLSGFETEMEKFVL